LRPHGGATCLESALQGMWSIVHHGGGLQALVDMWQLGFLVWRIGDGSGMPGASTMFLQGVVDPVEYIALEDRWSCGGL
jgi:hypothetical protein